MTGAEIGMFKVLLRHPSLTGIMTEDLLLSEVSVYVFRLIQQEDMYEGQITKTVFTSLVHKHRIKIDTKTINQIFAEIRGISSNKEIAKRELLALINIQKDESDKIELLSRMDKAKVHIRKNEVKQAEAILRSIHLSDAEDVLDSQQLMMDSIINTSGFKTGIPEIDNKKLAFAKGDITSVVSDSGAMKTYFVMWMLLKILMENDKFLGIFFEKEMEIKDVGRRLLSWTIKESSISILEKSVDDHEGAIKHYGNLIKEHMNDTVSDVMKRFIAVPNTRFNTPIDMLRYMERYDADVWGLDYMTQITSDNSNIKSYNEKVMDSINSLKQICAETETHGIIINQAKKDVSNSKDKRITSPKEIEWSKNIENVSANIYSLFYPWKHRDSFLKADFMNGIQGVPYKKSFYYLLDLKSRHTTDTDIGILEANPDHSSFNEFNEEEYKMALRWYDNYVSYVKGNEK